MQNVDRIPLMTDRLGLRRTRRMFVVLLYGGLLTYGITIGIVQTCQPTGLAWHVLLAITVAAIVAGATGYFGLWRLRALHVVSATASRLDERLLVRRNYALAVAFRIVAIVCTFECVAWQFRLIFTYPRGLDLASPFLAGDAALALTLPLAILAWTEPDPRRDDDPVR
jgi:hypothetical protein